VIDDLTALSTRPPERRPPTERDQRSPAPWLDAYAAGVGSPLELRFLRLLESHGVMVQKQTPISLRHGEPAISTADFTLPGKQVALYIDEYAAALVRFSRTPNPSPSGGGLLPLVNSMPRSSNSDWIFSRFA
jgi:hypothetical protein